MDVLQPLMFKVQLQFRHFLDSLPVPIPSAPLISATSWKNMHIEFRFNQLIAFLLLVQERIVLRGKDNSSDTLGLHADVTRGSVIFPPLVACTVLAVREQ